MAFKNVLECAPCRVAKPRIKPVVIAITKPNGLSFHTRHLDARGNLVMDNFFDVPAEDYGSGWDTGRRAAAELLAVIKAQPRNGTPVMGLLLANLLADVANALADRAAYGIPARRGAALGFLSVLDAAIQFAAHNADMQSYFQRELDRSEACRLHEVERKAAERVEFVARMQAARKAKREAQSASIMPTGIGMDMVPPFAVYADGVVIAKHDTEEQADECYARLRQQRAEAKKAVAT